MKESNKLWINLMTLNETVSLRGGAHWSEHPADPRCEPYPSLWATAEQELHEYRTQSYRATFHQCMLGADARKATSIAGTLEGLRELDQVWCNHGPGAHAVGGAIGKDEQGRFRTRALARHPRDMCFALARGTVEWLRAKRASTLLGP